MNDKEKLNYMFKTFESRIEMFCESVKQGDKPHDYLIKQVGALEGMAESMMGFSAHLGLKAYADANCRLRSIMEKHTDVFKCGEGNEIYDA